MKNNYRPLITSPTTKPFTVVKIMHEVAKAHNLSVDDIKGRCRKRHVVLARHEAVCRAYDAVPNYSMVGRLFELDHSSVMYAVKGKKGRHRARVS